MANILIKQGKEIAGSSLVTPSSKADKIDLSNIIQTGTASSQAISAGTYFYLNDTLVRAKVDIANGATFTLNTNYEVVTAGALNELKDSGWKSLNTYVKYRKIGKIVNIQTTFTAEVITSTTWSTFGILPVGCRPNVASFVTLYNDRASLHQMIRVNVDGTVQVNGNVTISGYMTYFVD